MKNETQEYANHLGKSFSLDCALDYWQDGTYKASVNVGELEILYNLGKRIIP